MVVDVSGFRSESVVLVRELEQTPWRATRVNACCHYPMCKIAYLGGGCRAILSPELKYMQQTSRVRDWISVPRGFSMMVIILQACTHIKDSCSFS